MLIIMQLSLLHFLGITNQEHKCQERPNSAHLLPRAPLCFLSWLLQDSNQLTSTAV